jgi:hypothetical protein
MSICADNQKKKCVSSRCSLPLEQIDDVVRQRRVEIIGHDERLAGCDAADIASRSRSSFACPS